MTRRRLGLPRAAWPEADDNAFKTAFAKEDRFHRGGAADWADTTRRKAEVATARWLGFLVNFEPAELTEDPVERLTEDLLTRYVDHLSETAGSVGRYIYLEHLQRALRVMFGVKAADLLKPFVAQLRREYRPLAKPWVTTPRLMALGESMMEKALAADGSVNRVAYRNGLMLMLWPPRPVRRRAFAQIRIGEQLRWVGDEWRLMFKGSEMKSGRPFQMTVPREVVPYLERFLWEVRPMFRHAENTDALWISDSGRPLALDSISLFMAQSTEAAFGVRIPPHRFRHCAASTIAILAPNRIQVAPALLDHSSLRTTAKHYIMARGIEASREYAKVIGDLTPRQSGRRRARLDSRVR